MFKAGDRLRCVNTGYNSWIRKGEEYEVLEVSLGGGVRVNTLDRRFFYDAAFFELVEDAGKYHPHYDLIIAWAKGAIIQAHDPACRNTPYGWFDTSDNKPSWNVGCKYRIKPSEKDLQISEIERQIEVLNEELRALEGE